MSQETSQEHSQRPGPSLFGKWLLLLLAIVLFIVLIVALRPSLFRAAWAGFARIVHAKNTPPPTPLVEHSKLEIQNPPVLAPQQQTPPSAEAQAQSLWAEFEKASWGAPFEAWSNLHSDLFCKPFRGSMWGGDADRQWSYRCSSGPEAEAGHWSFYVFGLEEPLVPRLEQFDVFTVVLPQEKLAAVQSRLQSHLVARFGQGEDRSPKVPAIRRVAWPQYQRWRTADVEIDLNLGEFNPQTNEGRLQMQARQRPLLEALKEDEHLRLVGAANDWYQVGLGIENQIADDLRPEFPDAATFLMKQQPDPAPPDPEKVRQAIEHLQTQIRAAQAGAQPKSAPRAAIIAMPASPPAHWRAVDFHDALVKLLANIQKAPRERQPEMLMAADLLAWRLPQIMTDDKSQAGHWTEWRTQLADFGVTYEESPIDVGENPWLYTGGLLKRVWTDYGDTDWGQRAFLVLLREGWDCGANIDAFHTVIQRGLEFQKTNTNSKYLPDVQMAVAQAYETWWSLSQAPAGGELSEEDREVQPAQYREGAEEARQKAIALYEHFLQTAPQGDYAAYARRVLPRLRLGLDTGQRRYYCAMSED